MTMAGTTVRWLVAAIGAAGAFASAGLAVGREPVSATDAVRAAVRARLGIDAAVEVESIDIAGDAPVFLEAHPDPAARLGRPMRFTLVTSAGARLPVTATVKVIGALVVTTRSVARGESLAAEDLDGTAREITDMPLRRLPRLDVLVGARALRALPAGEAVPGNAVAARRAVEPGDRVTVVVADGAVRVTATFVAADGGQPGAVIRVVNPETRRYLRGRVMTDGMIEVLDGR